MRWMIAVFTALSTVAFGTNSAADQLGTVTFPTSCAPQVQPTLERGLALLHSFQYDEAEQTFSEAAQQDTHCAMCHWGKAMALYHQIWDWPSPDTLQKGRGEIALAQQIGANTSRERGYLATAAVFFQDRPTLSHADRIRGYSRSLATLRRTFPKDGEVGAFYALSLIALAGENVDQVANLRRAIAVLQPLLREHPDHPGVTHYLIHAADWPGLAPLGLVAARKYADIAPDSSHALHMPSHIFVRLGLWQETIAVNLRAAAAGAQAAREHRGGANYQLHAMDYLDYAYLQSGQEAKARHILDDLSDVPGADEGMITSNRAYFFAKNAMDLHRWDEAATLFVEKLPPSFNVDTYRARTIGAARQVMRSPPARTSRNFARASMRGRRNVDKPATRCRRVHRSNCKRPKHG